MGTITTSSAKSRDTIMWFPNRIPSGPWLGPPPGTPSWEPHLLSARGKKRLLIGPHGLYFMPYYKNLDLVNLFISWTQHYIAHRVPQLGQIARSPRGLVCSEAPNCPLSPPLQFIWTLWLLHSTKQEHQTSTTNHGL